MIYVPPITDYRPFYVQYSGGKALDLRDEYAVVVKAHDYPLALTPKAVYANNWKDEDGEEEYIGLKGLFFEPFTYTLECVMFARAASQDVAVADLTAGMRGFVNALARGLFRVYDAWTGYGFQNVRLAEVPMPQEGSFTAWEGGARLIFSVKMKVNDPRTAIIKSGDYLIDPETEDAAEEVPEE